MSLIEAPALLWSNDVEFIGVGRPIIVILRVKTSHLFAGENQPPLRRFFHNIILSFCKRVETDFYCSWIVFGLDCRYLNGG